MLPLYFFAVPGEPAMLPTMFIACHAGAFRRPVCLCPGRTVSNASVANVSAAAPADTSGDLAAILIPYTGGIAGFNDHLSIDVQGHAVLTRRQGKFEFALTRDEMMRLEAALRDADLAPMPSR